MTHSLNIDKTPTPAKFQQFADEIIPFLIDKMRKLDALESEMLANQALVKASATEHDLKFFWKEYDQGCEAVIAPVWIGKKRGNMRSFGKPLAYEYLDNPSTKIIFTMKSADVALVETQSEFGMGLRRDERFSLRSEADGWKISSKKLRNGDKWRDVEF